MTRATRKIPAAQPIRNGIAERAPKGESRMTSAARIGTVLNATAIAMGTMCSNSVDMPTPRSDGLAARGVRCGFLSHYGMRGTRRGPPARAGRGDEGQASVDPASGDRSMVTDSLWRLGGHRVIVER